MARRSLRPQLNQIRAWVRQGRTDAWIAHQLEVSGSELREFRRQHDLTADDETGTGEIDLRDEIEAEIEAATVEEAEAEAEVPDDEPAESDSESDSGDDGDSGDEEGDAQPRRRRRRGRRGGRGRRRTELEATFDHGDSDGYGLWIDPSVKDNTTYAEHWAGHRAVTVTVEPDQIVIRRVGDASGPSSDDDSSDES